MEFEAALDELRRLGEEVTTDSVRGEDVTEKFVDLRSRERNLLAAEEVQGRIQYLEQSTASSQIFVGIRLVAEAPESPAWNPALVAAKA